ncbi:MAG: glycerophosphodiester phosphodiesterase [Treponema sp.]|nr:MAG: glycerophosphodiester phosphodiesterase [Treponema sp.]
MNKKNWFVLLFCVLSFYAFSTDIVAHRGASFDAPENTLASFKLAWIFGADAIEGDFYLTKDKKIVCIHDDTTKRTGNENLSIKNSTYQDLAKLDFSYKKEKKFYKQKLPLISQVFATVPEGKKIFIEIKDNEEIIPYLIQEINKSKLENSQIVIISFDRKVIKEFKKQFPQIKCYLLYNLRKLKKRNYQKLISILKDINADGIDTSTTSYLNKSWIKHFHDAGFEYHIYTIDECFRIKKYINANADSITTNKVYVAKKAMRN